MQVIKCLMLNFMGKDSLKPFFHVERKHMSIVQRHRFQRGDTRNMHPSIFRTCAFVPPNKNMTVVEDFYFDKIKDISTRNWCIKGTNFTKFPGWGLPKHPPVHMLPPCSLQLFRLKKAPYRLSKTACWPHLYSSPTHTAVSQRAPSPASSCKPQTDWSIPLEGDCVQSGHHRHGRWRGQIL